MSDAMSLEDVLSDKELPELESEQSEQQQEQPTGEESESEEKAGEKDDKPEKSDDEETEKDDDSTPESDDSKDDTKKGEEKEESWTKAAVLDERRKRQELQAELEKLKSGDQKPGEGDKPPDWYYEPDKAAAAQEQKIQTLMFTQKVELSQDMMRSQHEDYDEMEQKFFDMCQDNPTLRQELRQAPNPARFAYETAKKANEYEAIKDVDSYKSKLEAEIRKEVEEKVRKEYEEKQQNLDKKRAAADPSLASESSKGGLSSNDYSGPTPLDEILK